MSEEKKVDENPVATEIDKMLNGTKDEVLMFDDAESDEPEMFIPSDDDEPAQQEQVEEMKEVETADTEPVVEEEKKEEAPVEPEVTPEEKAEPSPVEQTPAETPPVDAAPAEEPVKAPEVDPKDAEIASLKEQVDLMSAKVLQQPQLQPQAQAQVQPQVPQQVQQAIPQQQFVDDARFEKVMSDKGELNNLLNEVQQSAIQTTIQGITQGLPQLILSIATPQIEAHAEAAAFFQKNPDLLAVGNFVKHVANEIGAQHPDWTVAQIYEATAPESRKRLNAQRAVQNGVAAVPGQQVVPVAPAAPAAPVAPVPLVKVPLSKRAPTQQKLQGYAREMEQLRRVQ